MDYQARFFILETLHLVEPVQTYNAEQRFFDDTTTWLAEALDGTMRTSFEYTFVGEELYAHDGSALSPIFLSAVSEAEQLTCTSPNIAFELRRRRHELDEYNEMCAMALGELPNTMVVISDFPAELMDSPVDVGGYNAQRKQTMLRVITRNPDGKVQVVSQSLDRSDRVALEKLYDALGFQCSTEQELLGQRMHMELDEEAQRQLVDHLMAAYDLSLAQRYGGIWHAGRCGDTNNTYQFVLAQTDLLAAYEEFGESRGTDQLYNLAAAMRNRYQSDQVSSNNHWVQSTNLGEAIKELAAGGQAARVGRLVFSGCGMSIGSSEEPLSDQLATQGYGNKVDNAESSYSFNKYMHCVVCQAPPKESESKKMCGPCGICRVCDIKLK